MMDGLVGVSSFSSTKKIANTFIEEIIEKEGFQLRIFLVCRRDVA